MRGKGGGNGPFMSRLKRGIPSLPQSPPRHEYELSRHGRPNAPKIKARRVAPCRKSASPKANFESSHHPGIGNWFGDLGRSEGLAQHDASVSESANQRARRVTRRVGRSKVAPLASREGREVR